MSPAKTFLLFSIFLLAAVTAGAQPPYRMMQSTDVGWINNNDLVTCTDTRGFAHHNSHTLTFYLNPSGQGAGKELAIQGALQAWTNVTNADFVLSWGGTRSNGYQQSDGYNMMVWGQDPLCDSLSCHAITAVLLEPGQVIKEADILFNANPNRSFQWMTNGQYSPSCWQTANSTGLMLDTQGIATHELGHALGIHHPFNYSTTTATMGNQACTVGGRTLETDDMEALRCAENRYPENPNYQGALDQATCESFSGWARNANHDYETSYVEIVEKLSTGFLNVIAVVPANGPGHTFSYDPLFNDGKWHKIRTRYSGTLANVGPDKDILCDAPLFPDSMRASQYPSTGGTVYTVGTQFSSTLSGKITQLGYLWPMNETGSHTIQLWSNTGTPMSPPIDITAPAFPPRWKWVALPTPVEITAGVMYRVSINTNSYQSKSPCGTTNSLQTPYTNGPLTAHQGLWKAGTGSPDIGSCSNFFVNVKFST
jgi:hypothetical protein